MKKGQIVEGIVTKVDFPNKGIVKVEGEEKTLIVKKCHTGTEGGRHRLIRCVKAKQKEDSWKCWSRQRTK